MARWNHNNGIMKSRIEFNIWCDIKQEDAKMSHYGDVMWAFRPFKSQEKSKYQNCALIAVCDSCAADWSRVFEQEFTFDTLYQILIWPYLFKVGYSRKYQHLLLMRFKMLNNTHCYSDVLPVCLNITQLKTVVQLKNFIFCNIYICTYIYI